jgi:predicted DNA-binding transcriptional regulator AlpA
MLLSFGDLTVALGISKETIKTWRRKNGFPHPISRFFIRWRSKEVADWIGISEDELLQTLLWNKQRKQS